ncbi:7969_t:CDS:10 [Entrophospora sp. SA101]|nr:7969_t:CDS:10 [Entrophospora sp. SA101]
MTSTSTKTASTGGLTSTTTKNDIKNYDDLLKRLLESELDNELSISSTEKFEGHLPPELEAALEDSDQAEKYLNDLKKNLGTTGLSDAMGRALDLLHNDNSMSNSSISRLVNGVSSLVDIEISFNQLRISELDLPTIPESSIKTAVLELYKLQEDLQIHLQGGPLSDPSTLGTQRRKGVSDLLERVMKETALYEEFVNKAQHLNLERILNESEDSSDEDFIDSETIDTESGTHIFEDSLSDTTRKSGATYAASSLSSTRFLRAPDQSFSRLSSASVASIRSYSSSSRHSQSTQSVLDLEELGLLVPPEPWEAFRWSPLIKVSEHLFSHNVTQSAGLATVFAVGNIIAIGTTRGLILVYDYSNLKYVFGNSSDALEYGSVTSLAISSDNTQIVSGHASGHIFMWDIQRSTSPVTTILPISESIAFSGRKEGHISGSAILHVGFVGARKNCIVSGDDCFMMVNRIETIRILGRYSLPKPQTDSRTAAKQKRPSTVFGLAPLPLGQISHVSESFGLVAILTPYKMIVVSTKPTAQTQYKYLKPKNNPNDAMSTSNTFSGCLAWYPAVKSQLTRDSPIIYSDPLLAYSWGNHLHIVTVTSASSYSDASNKKKRRPDRENRLEFIKIDIVVFDPRYMRESEESNIRQRSLVYHDRFSSFLKEVIDESNLQFSNYRSSIDLAYYHSLRVYKGNLFLLGVNQIYVGTLLSWNDRIDAFVQSGDFLEAISLATLFYNGSSSQTILGLPIDEESRHAIVGEELMSLLIDSINHAFSSERTFQGMIDENNGGGGGVLFHDLAVGCIEACLSMHKEDFLFNDVYERYAEASAKGILLEVLEPYILDNKINDLPPEIMKDLVNHYETHRMLSRIEQCIWRINPQCLDIDQLVQLCQSEGLYDALIYVWNRSMFDYVSPAVELLGVIRKVLSLEKRHKKKKHRHSHNSSNSFDSNKFSEGNDLQTMKENAHKFYTYLRNILTGNTYPNGAPLSEIEANEARTSLYSFVFSGLCVVWPKSGGELILTAENNHNDTEPTYPYLRLFLKYDTKAFLQALDEAFEDSYLNGVMTSGFPESSEFAHSDISHLYCFVARNLPKYPQFLLLPHSTLHRILVYLSKDNDSQTREVRQFAVECLLSIYTPNDENKMIELYENAGFSRVLEHIYKVDKKYGLLITTYLKDPAQKNEAFKCIEELLGQENKLTEKQRDDILNTIMMRIEEFVEIDGEKTASIIKTYFRGDHQTVITNLSSSPARLFLYLRGLLEPSQDDETNNCQLVRIKSVNEQIYDPETSADESCLDPEIHEKYIALMGQFDPTGVYHYLQTHQNKYRIENVLPICESSGTLDAVVWLLEKSGKPMGALNKIINIVQEKKKSILDLIERKKNSKSDRWSLIEKTEVDSTLMKLKGVLKIGILLCENSSRHDTSPSAGLIIDATLTQISRAPENESELLWYRLLDTFVDATNAITTSVVPPIPPLMSQKLIENGQSSSYEIPRSPIPPHIANHLITSFKSFVQSIMKSLLGRRFLSIESS